MARRRLSRTQRRRQLAVALRYDETQDPSPRVLAKGKGELAKRILQIAEEQKIPVREDPDLAESLIQLDLGQLLPPELYPAVAEILAYIYRQNNRRLRA
jgi:flagellar biosynthesis protein